MFSRKISKIIKRDGSIKDFDRNKIASAIAKAAISTGEDPKTGIKLLDKIEKRLFNKYKGRLPTVENIQNTIEEVLIKEKQTKVAKSYILYRQKRTELREIKKSYGINNNQSKLSINSIKVLQNRYQCTNQISSNVFYRLNYRIGFTVLLRHVIVKSQHHCFK